MTKLNGPTMYANKLMDRDEIRRKLVRIWNFDKIR